MIFDTHAHYDDESFKDDVDAIFQDLKNHDVSLVLDPGCDFQSSLNSLKLSEKYDFVYTAVGLHPEGVGDSSLDELEQLFMLLGHQKCVAIGEIGLDYYWDKSQKDLQKMVFRMQMEWAAETGKPVIIHTTAKFLIQKQQYRMKLMTGQISRKLTEVTLTGKTARRHHSQYLFVWEKFCPSQKKEDLIQAKIILINFLHILRAKAKRLRTAGTLRHTRITYFHFWEKRFPEMI